MVLYGATTHLTHTLLFGLNANQKLKNCLFSKVFVLMAVENNVFLKNMFYLSKYLILFCLKNVNHQILFLKLIIIYIQAVS